MAVTVSAGEDKEVVSFLRGSGFMGPGDVTPVHGDRDVTKEARGNVLRAKEGCRNKTR